MLRKIKLQNWKAHKQSEYEFQPGTNVIIGSMGAGKSSILQAISYAIFGTFSELKSKEIKVSDLTTRGEEGVISEVSLSLHPDHNEYNIFRSISNGSASEATVKDNEGKMLAGTNSSQVTNFLAEALNLDEDVFLRTAYARQNDIDLFLRLAPGDRKSKLDELMGLHKFENARKNCVRLANQIASKRDAQRNFLGNFDFEKTKGDIEHLSKEVNNLLSERQELGTTVIDAEKYKNELNMKIRTLRMQLDNYNRLAERREMYRKQLDDLKQRISDGPEESLDSVKLRLKEITSRIDEVKRAKQHSRDDLERGRTSSLGIEKDYGALEEKSSDVISILKEIDRAKVELDNVKSYGTPSQVQTILTDLDDKITNNLEIKNKLSGEIGVLESHLAELQGVDGVCPVCSTRLEHMTKDVLIQERRGKIDSLKTRVSEIEISVQNHKTEKIKLQEVYEKQKEFLQTVRNESELRQREREYAIKLSELKGRRAAFTESFSQLSNRADNLDKEIANLEEEKRTLSDKVHTLELRNQKHKIAKDLESIEKAIAGTTITRDAVENVEQQYRTAAQKLEQVLSRQKSLDYIIEEKRKRLTDLEARQNQFQEIEKDIDDLGKKIDFLNQFKNALLAAQETLRKELITAVNEVMDSIWGSIYPYDRWTSVRLNVTDSDYVLQLREYEGEWLNVAGYASGGERIIAALALRIAFTKILLPQLNVLILDEPTHNMDDRAISTFVEVLQNDLSSFLDQIFIITHNEKLAEAGNNVIRL